MIGTDTVNSAIANSNSWGANAHLPIHSNAQGYFNCNTSDVASRGTTLIYYDTQPQGAALSLQLLYWIGEVSPGTGDKVCRNLADGCTSIKPLGELAYVKATAAYNEVEYHDWNFGTNFLTQTDWKWRLGAAVDSYYGYPR